MPEFLNPFSGKVPERKLTKQELIRAIRLDIAAEHEAIHLYMAHAEAIDDPLAKEVLIDIANEEREHVGEFMRLLEILTGDEEQWIAQGRAEVDEMIAEAAEVGAGGGTEESSEGNTEDNSGEQTTIGALRS
jgi:rubrerythrin